MAKHDTIRMVSWVLAGAVLGYALGFVLGAVLFGSLVGWDELFHLVTLTVQGWLQ